MSLALQISGLQEDSCLNFEYACELTAYACSLIDREFTPERIARIAITFDAGVRAGEQWDRSMIAAIDREIEINGDPIATVPPTKPKPAASEAAFGLARLPPDEEAALLVLIESHGLALSALACYMTRQTGEGYASRRPNIEWRLENGEVIVTKVTPRKTRISYDLMLCEYCGNLEPSARCPAKLRALQARLIERDDNNNLTRLID